ncbi:MAG: sterol desaturase family protein [Vicinamibacterales bacterium]|jgi:sterol desaturase/sphingolipid hydroxylase (fatty acid hydroxylase superfamily)|nr:fatty acid hydroxylase [Acidobacteriota bacterium]MDP6372511.1 sterol desaturase family protein [Vicinamibacterales bacterium]MDP6610453.1 sterol desaturase family protein [Vicinamibacterales bacterium]MQG69588.1 sterol desaturase family protein [SAR202 cluster bacterium]HAK53862.1 fatty acid hydroxylase [Acidobacteriota bacterium]|tara:strand:+ start:12980 stop:13762 length:783 start_codon:yes stop_codon:yes gene_type:complete
MLTPEAIVRLSAFAGVFGLMALWELVAPRRRLRVGKRRWAGNVPLIIVNAVLLRVGVPLGAYGTAEVAAERGCGALQLVDAPAFAEVAVAVLLLDFTIYLQHRVFHAVPVLWRLHKVHHADNDFDVTTGLRFHTVSIVLSMGVKMAATVAIGASPLAVLIAETALNVTAMFNHANVRMPVGLDRVLRLLVVTPDMHRVHHSVEGHEYGRNFGFNFPWWDRLLGTYRDQPAAGHDAMTIGLDEYQAQPRQSLWWMIALPFR